jgi:hypothetical protein
MNIRPLLHSALLAFGTAASAAGVSITPAAPTPLDDVVVEITAPRCSSIAPDGVEMTDGRVIRVHYNDGTGGICFGEPQPTPKVTVGRLPAGTYRIELVPNLGASPGAGGEATFTVAYASGAPPDDYSGHWLTGVNGEGVFVTQFGSTAFVSWLYQGADGKSTWLVMPEARWGLDDAGALRFAGEVYRVENQPMSTGTAQVISRVAAGSFYPAGAFFDTAFLRIPQLGVDRTLTRLRFQGR